jgi:hypothetical protein
MGGSQIVLCIVLAWAGLRKVRCHFDSRVVRMVGLSWWGFHSASSAVKCKPGHAVSPDVDGDGLPNSVEETGWYNAAGGPFVTNYLDSDSDDDGLSDGQEKLYNTHPLYDHSPGIFVEYLTRSD